MAKTKVTGIMVTINPSGRVTSTNLQDAINEIGGFTGAPPTTGTNLLKADGLGGFADAVAGVDFASPGINTDITTIAGLTTPLSIAQGGTGSNIATGTGSNVLSQSPTITGLLTAENITVQGDLNVNGTITTVESNTVVTNDPIIQVGGTLPPVSDDNKDRGVQFRWNTGTTAKLGFFGFDDSSGMFSFIPDATETNYVYSGAVGGIHAGYLVAGSVGVDQTKQHTIPNVASDTIALLGATQTLTNKTISSPTITGTAAGSWTASGVVTFSNTTASTSKTTGAVKISGGLGVVGDVWAANFNGALKGTADNATKITVSTDNTTNSTVYPVWSSLSSGSIDAKTSSTKLQFNPSSGTLTASTFVGSLSGNATSASKLATGRNINGVAFDGQSNISVNLNNSLTFSNTGNGGGSGTTFNGSAARTISYNSVGAPSTSGTNANGTWDINITGNAATANTLANARTINGVSFDGSANISINTNNGVTYNNSGAGNASGTVFNGSAARTVSYNTIGAPSTTGANASGTWGISISGNAATATKLATIRTISLTGGVSGSATFDGTANASIVTTVGNDSHTHSNYALHEVQQKTVTTVANKWYRIATSESGIGRNSGTFRVRWGVSGQNFHHGVAVFTAATQFGQAEGTVIDQHSYSTYGTSSGFVEARIVYHGTTYTGNFAYVELRFASSISNVSFEVVMTDGVGWTTMDPSTLGSIPTGYSTYSYTFKQKTDTGTYQSVTVAPDGRVTSGSGLSTLTRGSYLTGNNYSGTSGTTWAVDATSANTANKVVARDASGNFSAGTITATLNGNASTATSATSATTAGSATTATTATNATNVAVGTSSSTMYFLGSTSTSGNIPPKVLGSGAGGDGYLYYDAGTQKIRTRRLDVADTLVVKTLEAQIINTPSDALSSIKAPFAYASIRTGEDAETVFADLTDSTYQRSANVSSVSYFYLHNQGVDEIGFKATLTAAAPKGSVVAFNQYTKGEGTSKLQEMIMLLSQNRKIITWSVNVETTSVGKPVISFVVYQI